MRRSGPPNRYQRLRSRSAKARSQQAERRAVVERVIARDGAVCRAAWTVPEVECAGPLDPDEYDLRSARPGGHLDETNVQLLCRAHHDWKHRHPIEAARRGLRPFPASYTGDDGTADRQMPL